MLTMMKDSGYYEMTMAIESGNQKVLKDLIRKPLKLDKAREINRAARELGISRFAYFIIGFPGETNETALRTRQFIKSIEYPGLEGTLSWTLFPFCLYPLSPIYEIEMRKKYGLTGPHIAAAAKRVIERRRRA